MSNLPALHASRWPPPAGGGLGLAPPADGVYRIPGTVRAAGGGSALRLPPRDRNGPWVGRLTDRELALQAAGRAVADEDADGAGVHLELSEVVVEADIVRSQREGNCLALAWRQRDPLESVEPTDGLQDAGPVLVGVEL